MARPSHVRTAVAEVIASSRRHAWTVEDVRAVLRDRGVPADPSSVFRALVRLSESGELARLDLGDGRARFERHQPHHEHIVCSACGAVAAVSGCLIEQAVPAVESQTGFVVSEHRLTFSGRCGSCAVEA